MGYLSGNFGDIEIAAKLRYSEYVPSGAMEAAYGYPEISVSVSFRTFPAGVKAAGSTLRGAFSDSPAGDVVVR
jgi:hypothetical protein